MSTRPRGRTAEMSTIVYDGGLRSIFFLSSSILNVKETRKSMKLYYITRVLLYIMQEIFSDID